MLQRVGVGTDGFPRAGGLATAAVAALTATGVAHLLAVSTPDPLSYLGWIIGLCTGAALVAPLNMGAPANGVRC